MATTAVEHSKTRSDLAQLAGTGPVSPISILAGVLVGYSTFALLLGGAIAVLHHRGSKLDLTESWGHIGTRGGLLVGLLLFVSYLWAGYVAGRMAWRRGILHGIGVFVGSILVVGAVALLVRSLTKPKDVKAVTDALRLFGIPTTRDEWRHVGSFAGVASLGGMLLGSVLGGFLGEHWFTKLSRRAQAAEVDVRERLAATNTGTRSRATERSGGNGHGNGNGNGRGRRSRIKEIDLDELSKEELYEMAQEMDIPGRSQMTKEELKEALSSAMQLQG
ncbi:MAG: hypothetical protein QOD57_2536 [Actinomycetota bacterium]|jgi:hypothetical protein|nr:hypothetical protein [Actinomycetota bacterium]MDQ1504809.1 hypothetical protein [Actinomycetota bacterium]